MVFFFAGSDYALWFVTPLVTCQMQPQAQLKDCAPQDSEELKMITHDSGIHVIFENEQKLGQIRNAIATDGQFRNVNFKCNCWQFRKCKCIVKLKKACIFIDFHLDVELQQDVYQIGVGIIEHIKVTQYTLKLLLKFCPVKVRSQQRVF